MNKIQKIMFISVFVFLLHTLEEYFFGFIETDASIKMLSNIFDVSRASAYWIVQVLMAIYLLLLVFYRPAKKMWYLLLGIIFIVEVSHFWETLTGGYAPGFWTAIPLVILGMFFWREFLLKKQ